MLGLSRQGPRATAFDARADQGRAGGGQGRGPEGRATAQVGCRECALAVNLYRGKQHTIVEICDTLDITKPTLYSYVQDEEGECSPRSEWTLHWPL